MMSCEKYPSDSVHMSLESSCTQPDLPPTSPTSATSSSVAQESSFPPPFLFSRPDSSIPRKVRKYDMFMYREHTRHDSCPCVNRNALLRP